MITAATGVRLTKRSRTNVLWPRAQDRIAPAKTLTMTPLSAHPSEVFQPSPAEQNTTQADHPDSNPARRVTRVERFVMEGRPEQSRRLNLGQRTQQSPKETVNLAAFVGQADARHLARKTFLLLPSCSRTSSGIASSGLIVYRVSLGTSLVQSHEPPPNTRNQGFKIDSLLYCNGWPQVSTNWPPAPKTTA